MKTAACDLEKPQSIQQKLMHRKSDTDRSQQKSVYHKRDAHTRSRNIQQKVGSAVRLSQEQPSDEDEYSQNSGAYLVTPAWQCNRKTQPMWNTEHMEQREMTEYHTVGWKTSAHHAVAGLNRTDREEAYRYFQPST